MGVLVNSHRKNIHTANFVVQDSTAFYEKKKNNKQTTNIADNEN